MRVSQIDICDFRGFPGPTKYEFVLGDARNLLLYGENGSGKSSLFRGIEEFFNMNWKTKEFRDFKNAYSDPSLTSGNVTFHFDDSTVVKPLAWNFGGVRPVKDPLAANTALRLSCIDYRALLRTNFIHQGDNVNLFDLAVNHLLAHYPVTVRGGSTTIGELWRKAQSLFPTNHRGGKVNWALSALSDFNVAFAPVIPALAAKAEELLSSFPACDFKLTLDFAKIDYDTIRRQYTGKELDLHVYSKGTLIPTHHHFLNEARLSSIALAIFLASLLVSIPAPVPGGPIYPKVLVLDDVLIGLDMSNRIPVLETIKKHFSDWQVFLFTHDKIWAEIVQLQTRGDKSWSYCELYLAEAPDGIETPMLRPSEKGWDYFLARARHHLAVNDERAAAVYARATLESKLKSYCDKYHLPVKYDKDPRRVGGDDFWRPAKDDAIKKARAASDAAKEAALNVMFADIEVYRKLVLNPLSHSAATPVTKAEIQGAVDAVSRLVFE